ncbi:hypothetical protein RHRU231_90010 [Rhodococcus ruber]|uniref:Uncharacterized protein n=1 Tax=Rhodococcus ruber TaxID=1830 RepID=A0A098BUN9_9NOCA|nr:hypothetical protein RHRU231_90010 [Rhodococcus ruber]
MPRGRARAGDERTLRAPRPLSPPSELVADRPQQGLAVGDIGARLHAHGRVSVDHPGDAPTEIGLGDDDLDRVGRGAEDAADLRYLLQRVQEVHRVPVLDEHEERVTRAHRQGVAPGQLDEPVVVAGEAHEARPGRLAERHAEPQVRTHPGQCFVQILDGLDEVGLPDDDVHVVGLVDRHDVQLHDRLLGCPADRQTSPVSLPGRAPRGNDPAVGAERKLYRRTFGGRPGTEHPDPTVRRTFSLGPGRVDRRHRTPTMRGVRTNAPMPVVRGGA